MSNNPPAALWLAALWLMAPACAEPPPITLTPARAITSIPAIPAEEDRCRILPTSKRTATRAPYTHPKTHHTLSIESGSLSALALVRFANGWSNTPAPAPDRPYTDLAHYIRRTRPSAHRLGQLRRAALDAPSAPPRDLGAWSIIKNTAWTPKDLDHMIASANHCPEAALKKTLGDGGSARIKAHRPIKDLDALLSVPRTSKSQLMKLAHLGWTGACHPLSARDKTHSEIHQ